MASATLAARLLFWGFDMFFGEQVHDYDNSKSFSSRAGTTLNTMFRMLKELADALVRCGYPAEIIFPDQFSLLKYHPKSVLLGMNLGRSSFPNLDPRTPVVTWFQDVFPGDKESYEAHATPNDFFVSLGSPEPLGLSSRSEFHRGILFTGVSGRILSADYRMPEARNLYDFGLAAGVPLPMINPVLKSGLFGLLELS